MKATMVRSEHSHNRWDVFNPQGHQVGINLSYHSAQMKCVFTDLPALLPIWAALNRKVRWHSPPHHGRMDRGLQIVHAGGVSYNGRPNSYLVQSQSHPGIRYLVKCGPDAWTCSVYTHPNASKPGDWCPDIASGQAPDFGHGPRCKHMLAVMFHRELKKKGASGLAGTEARREELDPEVRIQTQSTTTPPDCPDPRKPQPDRSPSRIAAYYPDGRPAKRADGTVIRYTGGGLAVELPEGV